MSSRKHITVALVLVFIAASTMAAMTLQRKKVTERCRDIRVAMDGAFMAQVESGGLSPTTELIIYKELNRKHVKVATGPVKATANSEGLDSYISPQVQLVIHSSVQQKTGRQLASLQGRVNGEAVNATLGCEN